MLLLLAPAVAVAQETDELAVIEGCLANQVDDPASCINSAANPCQEEPGGSTTPGIAQCLSAEADAWDALLNRNYQSRLEAAAGVDAELGEAGTTAEAEADLRTAQRAWIAFRDAECDRQFSFYAGGTIRTVVHAQCRLSLTAERALAFAAESAN